ncbi:hypothetical protein J4E83_003625 [Alternaria metachromatica]|uniref:uncharacterized protein n=1 Tax=Alternaria metachromatica TaxID=283354 RepID=UPI0020C49794|nr:uncharacterized protein J4E83_003625 [Alternaria metachromatica]KAI4626474.1 hypothetical protein J4E83_003625 [Alternaria metachromatica]
MQVPDNTRYIIAWQPYHGSPGQALPSILTSPQTLLTDNTSSQMDHLHLSNSEIDEEYPLMASVEAQMRGVTMSASNSRFLNLPGELRNKIYSFCIDADPVPLRLRHDDPIKPVGGWRCFTQTCRQIRKEFHIIYMTETAFRLESTYHYARYIRDFYPPSDEATMLRYRGHIISVVGHSRDEDMDVDEFYDADIARVVSLVARSPKVRFTFELQKDLKKYSMAAKCIAQVNSMLSLFANSSNSKWRDMGKSIKEMRLRVHFFDSALRITMEKDMAKKWKTVVYGMWNEEAQPALGIRELRLSWPDPNPQERSYGYRHKFWFSDDDDKTKSYIWHSQPDDVFGISGKVLWIITQ